MLGPDHAALQHGFALLVMAESSGAVVLWVVRQLVWSAGMGC